MIDWLWKRLILGIVGQGVQFQCRLFLFGPGIGIWRSCRFVGALMTLCSLHGGLGRFVPCAIGANHCRLRHIGWEKCGHGLTSRCSSFGTLLDLAVRCLLVRCPLSTALYGLLVRSLVGDCQYLDMLACLVTAESGVAEVDGVGVGGDGVCWVSGSGPGWKTLRLHRNPPSHLAGFSGAQSRPRVWKRLRHVGHSIVPQDEVYVPVQHRTGMG